ncbi:hypothetical protein Tco_1175789 [Tanacetum coccineum]
MSEAENHPPASSVTALRIPIIKKGEYDVWCMKMRQYIAITDHILWDIITNGRSLDEALILDELPKVVCFGEGNNVIVTDSVLRSDWLSDG